MNILDLKDKFDAEIEFIGDHECDYNELTITRFTDSGLRIRESYVLKLTELDDLKHGLKIMLDNIEEYTTRETF